MASISGYFLHHHHDQASSSSSFSLPRAPYHRASFKREEGETSPFGFLSYPPSHNGSLDQNRRRRRRKNRVGAALEEGAQLEGALEKVEVDVGIVGCGIIGLSIAQKILRDSKLSVAVIDSAQPCAGATGAGQGYIWLGHRKPGTSSWALAKRSKELWQNLIDEMEAQGLDPLSTVGWKKTGSLLFTSSANQAKALQNHTEALLGEGVDVDYVTASQISKLEPNLKIGSEGSAALTLNDGQIDAHLAVSYIEKANQSFGSIGRFRDFYHDPVVGLLWSQEGSHIEGIKTARRLIYCKERVIIAAGAWSGILMSKVFTKRFLPFVLPTRPRQGQLLIMENYPQLHLNHALMEFEYCEKSSPNENVLDDSYGIAMTATTDHRGYLLLGSSRRFVGFDCSPNNEILDRILHKTAKFLPALENVSVSEALSRGQVRIGLRPFVPDGKPFIGPVPSLPGVLLATGHEGSGLCMALGTAELVLDMIKGTKPTVDPSPFLPTGRLLVEK